MTKIHQQICPSCVLSQNHSSMLVGMHLGCWQSQPFCVPYYVLLYESMCYPLTQTENTCLSLGLIDLGYGLMGIRQWSIFACRKVNPSCKGRF